jgi:hypothetical protein
MYIPMERKIRSCSTLFNVAGLQSIDEFKMVLKSVNCLYPHLVRRYKIKPSANTALGSFLATD